MQNKPKNNFVAWLDSYLPISGFFSKHFVQFKVPKNLNYFYTFGGILCLLIISQILTGLVVAVHYVASVDKAFASMEEFARYGAFGWLFKPWHSIGASCFFIAAYIHMAKNIYYQAYIGRRAASWFFGVLIFFMMMAISFFGYVLVWGQMSYAAVTVVSNFFLSIPFFGETLRLLFLGGYEIGQATLSRFYIFHMALTVLLIVVIALHIISIHIHGQTHPASKHKQPVAMVPFYPFFWIKDLFAIVIFILFFAWLLFFMPDYMSSPANYIEADPLVPVYNLQPEWYFLPFYAMIKAINFTIGDISSATIGVWLLIFALVILFFVPRLNYAGYFTGVRSIFYKLGFWLFIFNFVYLGVLATRPLIGNTIWYMQLCILYYFSFFLVILPSLSYWQRKADCALKHKADRGS